MNKLKYYNVTLTLKRGLVTMEVTKVFDIKNCSDDELFEILNNNFVPTASTLTLTELVRRLYSTIKEQQTQIEQLKSNSHSESKKQNGRKREALYIRGTVLDDNYLIYLIDEGYYKIPQLEKELGAHKNQIRNRYKRAKRRIEQAP